MRSEPLLSPLGAPCIAPPWGTLAAVDLSTGDKRWEVPLGTLEEMAPWPLSRIKGAPSIGGPSVSAGGLTFIAATPDSTCAPSTSRPARNCGRPSCRPAATPRRRPIAPRRDQRQFVVIAAGGHFGMPQEPTGDYLIAFALPARQGSPQDR